MNAAALKKRMLYVRSGAQREADSVMMPRSVRAAQFAPCAALAGFEEAVREAEEAFVRSQSQA